MLYYLATSNVFHNFADNRCEGNGSIICWVCFVSFFEHRWYEGMFPLCRYCTRIKWLLENMGQYRCYFHCYGFISVWMNTIEARWFVWFTCWQQIVYSWGVISKSCIGGCKDESLQGIGSHPSSVKIDLKYLLKICFLFCVYDCMINTGVILSAGFNVMPQLFFIIIWRSHI